VRAAGAGENGPVPASRTVRYTGGKLMDVYVPPGTGAAPVVLLWHGRGPDERDVLAALAEATARRGVLVCVPDWRSDAPGRGRDQLLASLEFTRREAGALGGDPGRIVLAGWSLGGRSAAGVAVRPAAAGGWRPAAVCLGSGFAAAPAPATGSPPLDDLLRGGAAPVPFWLVHGTRDPVVSVARSREFAAALARRGWPARLVEPDTDHAGVVMAEYVPELGRCRPARTGPAAAAGLVSARVLAAAAGGVPSPLPPGAGTGGG
jgi:acetyl esterase/lipase